MARSSVNKANTKKIVTKTSPAKKTPAKSATKAAVKPEAKKPIRAPRAPIVAKADLRAQIEKLEESVALLRTKNRLANKDMKAANARIAELEAQLAAAEKSAAKAAPSKTPAKKPIVKKARPALLEAPEIEEPWTDERPEEPVASDIAD